MCGVGPYGMDADGEPVALVFHRPNPGSGMRRHRPERQHVAGASPPLADIAGGNGVSASTVRRRLLEVIDLLAARAPRLDHALTKIARSSGPEVTR